jgi:hypothetical protein
MIQKIVENTRFYKEGGSCFECCDYEGMMADLHTALTDAYRAGYEARDREVGECIAERKKKHFIDDGKAICPLPHEYCEICEHNAALTDLLTHLTTK